MPSLVNGVVWVGGWVHEWMGGWCHVRWMGGGWKGWWVEGLVSGGGDGWRG